MPTVKPWHNCYKGGLLPIFINSFGNVFGEKQNLTTNYLNFLEKIGGGG